MPATSTLPRDVATLALRLLQRHGVDYADVRIERFLHEELVAEGGAIATINHTESLGLGIRVLVHGSWGFASTPHLTARLVGRAVTQAIDLAKAARLINRQPRPLAPVVPARAHHVSRCAQDPFAVPLAAKIDLLLAANQALLGPDAIKRATTHLDFFRRHKLFCSTEGAEIEQTLTESGAGLEVVAEGEGRSQVRSFPNSHHGALAQAGFEYVESLGLVPGATQARQEVLQLLQAPPPKAGETTLVLDPTQMVMQLHESCGHPTELDRALGHELSYAGGSFMTPDQLNTLQYGSSRVNIVADATIADGAGSFAFDDEGVPAQRVDLVRQGRFVGYLSSRETAARLHLPASGGAMRADGWSVPPLVRMTNVNLLPGTGTREELCRGIEHGYLLSTNKSWSIDDQRLNFQFTTEIGWEIINGRLGRMVANPLYTGITPAFWGRCTAVGRPEDWQLWGVPNCAKGEPMQVMHVGHGSSYARFDGVMVAPAQ
jgi:TldD protein